MLKRILLTLLLALGTTGAQAATPCRDSPLRQGVCFETRGRLSVGNGNPSWRIGPTGSRRMLGVMDGLRSGASSESGGLPPAVLRATQQSRLPNNTVMARFVVCPLSRDIPGHMRTVCIAGMK